MFGFWRKAKQNGKEITEAVIDDLSELLIALTVEVAAATGCMDDEIKNLALMRHAGTMRIGFEMIRAGYHPREVDDPVAANAARLAHAAVNTAILTSKLDLENVAGDLRNLLSVQPAICRPT